MAGRAVIGSMGDHRREDRDGLALAPGAVDGGFSSASTGHGLHELMRGRLEFQEHLVLGAIRVFPRPAADLFGADFHHFPSIGLQ